MFFNQLWMLLLFVAISINPSRILVYCAQNTTTIKPITPSSGKFLFNSMENVAKSLIKINDYIEWILKYFPKSKTNNTVFHEHPHNITHPSRNNANVLACLDFAIDFTHDNIKQRSMEEKFIEIFYRKISTNFQQTFRYETFFSRIYPEPYFCEFFILITMNHNTLMDKIRLWNVTKKSKYFIVIWASEYLAEGRIYDDEIMDINRWPTNLFTHPELVVILNNQIYKLNTPFQRAERRFSKISVEQFQNWELFDIENADEFGGKHFKVSTIDCPPQNYWRYDKAGRQSFVPVPGDAETMCQKKSYLPHSWNKNCKKPYGVEARLVSVLAEKLNFTWHIFYPAVNEYGSVQPDNSEDGMVGELMQSRADMVYCNLWVQYARNARIEFAAPYYQTCLTFLVPRPVLLPFNWFSIFRGFSDNLWIAIFIFFTCLGILGWLFGKLGTFFMKITEKLQLDMVFIELVSILTTGNSVPSSAIPGYSFLLTCWSLFTLFIITLYSSDLVSFLTVPRFTPRINTLEDFAASNLTWGIFRHTDFEYLDINRPVDQVIRRKHRYETYEHQDLVAKGINERTYAVMMIYQGGKSVSVQLGVDDFPYLKTRLMQSCLYRPYITPALRINSPYKPTIENTLVRMFETGLLHYIRMMEIRRQYPPAWESVFVETDTQSSDPQVLTIGHIYGAYYLLAVGLSLSVIVFLFEQLQWKWHLMKMGSVVQTTYKG